MNQAPKKNLIISPVGADKSCHKTWIAGQRSFDLMLVNYGDVPGRYREDAQYYFEIKGFKLEILKKAAQAHREIVNRYDAVWLPDDDLLIHTSEINKMFEIFHAYELDIAQPSIKNNFLSHPVLKRCFWTRLRYVSFIEMMCPLFSKESLSEVLPIFDLTRSGWGIDILWSSLLKNKRMAVIDQVGVVHTKPYSPDNLYYRKLHELGIDPGTEQRSIEEKYNIHRDYSIKKMEFYSYFHSWAQPFLKFLYRMPDRY